MRRYRNKHRHGGSDGSFWLSFSDLMSALVLIFILILFYSMYQYFDMYEIKEAELARRQFALDETNTRLEDSEEKLSAQEQAMIAQEIKLQAAEQGLSETEDILAQQKTELENTQSELSEKESQLTELENQLAEQQTTLDAQQQQLESQQTTMAEQQATLDAQQTTLENQQQQLEQLTGMRTKIVVALSDALSSANISATVDSKTGSITLASDVLFGTGESVLSDAGKSSIDAFLPVYLNVLLSDEYRPYVSEIIIEGHTDSMGGYIYNLELSQQRALAVASYILDDAYNVITPAQKATLREITTANGRSYSDSIVVNGVEDQNASRRVVFKFRLTDEQMIEQMKEILEKSDTSSSGATVTYSTDTTEAAGE